jgi:hypothetical protein
MAAEGVAVFRRSDFHAVAFFFGPMTFSAMRAINGTKRGRFRRLS